MAKLTAPPPPAIQAANAAAGAGDNARQASSVPALAEQVAALAAAVDQLAREVAR